MIWQGNYIQLGNFFKFSRSDEDLESDYNDESCEDVETPSEKR